MYLDLEVIDFHCHFPTNLPWFAGMFGEDYRDPERVWASVGRHWRGEQAMAYSKQWRLTWGFDPPESNPPDDDTKLTVGIRN